MNSNATSQFLPQLQFRNAGHYDTGTTDPLQAQTAGTMPPPKTAGPVQGMMGGGAKGTGQNPLSPVSAPIAAPPSDNAPPPQLPGTEAGSDIHQLPQTGYPPE